MQLHLCFFMSFSVLSTFSSLKENIFLLWADLGLEGKEVRFFHTLCLECPFWLCLKNYYSPFRSSSDVISYVRPLRLKLTPLSFFFFSTLRDLTYRHLTTVVFIVFTAIFLAKQCPSSSVSGKFPIILCITSFSSVLPYPPCSRSGPRRWGRFGAVPRGSQRASLLSVDIAL